MNKEEICDFVGRWNIEPAEDLDSYIRGNLYNFICKECGYTFSWKLRFDRSCGCKQCHPSDKGSSKGECELYDLLATSGLKIIHNDRTVISPKELDIYFPDLKFAIEYDGAYYHRVESKDQLKIERCQPLKMIDIPTSLLS